MTNHKLVLPEHLNHYGFLFGGWLLHWVDECSYIAANLGLPGNRFVTIGLDKVVFKQSIKLGSILTFDIKRTKCGETSATYNVSVLCDSIETGAEELVFETNISFVNVDDDGNKMDIKKDD